MICDRFGTTLGTVSCKEVRQSGFSVTNQGPCRENTRLCVSTLAPNHLFGPVPSRRLGVSLGVDLVPHKTCTLNCVYCECGATSRLTTRRAEYVPTANVLAELDDYLGRRPSLDHVTFSGSGEPTLHSGLGLVARHIHDRHPGYRTALLTNGTLFHLPDVRADAMEVDLVCASIDAVTADVFQALNRPAPGLSPDQMTTGLESFARNYGGELLIEVFVAAGINDSPEEIARIREAVDAIGPHRVQLNTLDRPGTEAGVQPVGAKRLLEIARELGGAEILADTTARVRDGDGGDPRERIMATIRRRPCTVEDMARFLGLDEKCVRAHVEELTNEEKIVSQRLPRGVFHRAVR